MKAQRGDYKTEFKHELDVYMKAIDRGDPPLGEMKFARSIPREKDMTDEIEKGMKDEAKYLHEFLSNDIMFETDMWNGWKDAEKILENAKNPESGSFPWSTSSLSIDADIGKAVDSSLFDAALALFDHDGQSEVHTNTINLTDPSGEPQETAMIAACRDMNMRNPPTSKKVSASVKEVRRILKGHIACKGGFSNISSEYVVAYVGANVGVNLTDYGIWIAHVDSIAVVVKTKTNKSGEEVKTLRNVNAVLVKGKPGSSTNAYEYVIELSYYHCLCGKGRIHECEDCIDKGRTHYFKDSPCYIAAVGGGFTLNLAKDVPTSLFTGVEMNVDVYGNWQEDVFVPVEDHKDGHSIRFTLVTKFPEIESFFCEGDKLRIENSKVHEEHAMEVDCDEEGDGDEDGSDDGESSCDSREYYSGSISDY